MSSLALMEVQRALYAKLTGDGALMGMISGVHDVVPPQTALPYIVIGDGQETLQAADALNVTECRLDVHVWTEAGGRKTALAIMNRLHAIMHLGTLSLTGFQLINLRVEQAQTSLSDQGTTLSGVLRLLVTVAEVGA